MLFRLKAKAAPKDAPEKFRKIFWQRFNTVYIVLATFPNRYISLLQQDELLKTSTFQA
jgi:hypothetical protein